MRIISKLIGRYSLMLFGFAIILSRVPPFYIFFYRSFFFNSYNVAGYILFILLVFRGIEAFRKGGKMRFQDAMVVPVFLFFISQSFSVLPSINLGRFLSGYRDIFFSLLFFMVALEEITSKKRFYQVMYIIFVAVLFNLLIQTVLYMQPEGSEDFFSILRFIFTDAYMKGFEINAGRNRFFVDVVDAALLPIFFILLDRLKKIWERIFLAGGALWISALTFMSNFRAQLVILFLSFVFGGLIYLKKTRFIVRFLIISVIVLYLLNHVTAAFFGYNALDRLISPNTSDYMTIIDRFYFWRLAVEMGQSSPALGIGLGNFFDHIPGVQPVSLSLFDSGNDFFKITWVHPHNIFLGVFAETGFFGLTSFLVALLSFVVMDARLLLRRKSIHLGLLITSFWLVFLFSLINAPISLYYLGLFWLLRGIIAAVWTNKVVL